MSASTRDAATALLRTAGKGIFPLAMVLTAVALFVPLAPVLPASGLDHSWMLGMNQAVAQGLVFGRDIVFTFGPYASAYTREFHPATDARMLWSTLFLAASFALVATVVFRDARWPWRLALPVVLAGFVYSRDALLFFMPLLAGAHVFLVASPRRTATTADDEAPDPTSAAPARPGDTVATLGLLAASFAPLGLLPLIKGSLLVACVAVAGLAAMALATQRRRAAAAVVAGVPGVVLVVAWLLAAQPPAALPGYFAAMLPITGGYTEAMSEDGSRLQIAGYLVAAAVLLGAFLVGRWRNVPAIALAGMFAAVLFLGFKGGFVRHDFHAVLAGNLMLLAAVLAGALLPGWRAVVVLVAGVVAWAVVDAGFVHSTPAEVARRASALYTMPWHGARERLRDPAWPERRFDSRLAEIAASGGLPKLDGTVDLYAHDQAFLIAAGNRWHPRPVLQSYSAYTPGLAERNRRHLAGDGRPRRLLFAVQPLGDRLPALDDGASWPELLARYRPRSFANGFLVLAERGGGGRMPAFRPSTGRREARLGDWIDVPRGAVFAKLDVQPTLLGRAATALFKPGRLSITFALRDGSERRFRLVAGMARSGFLVSPLVTNTEEFGLLFAGAEFLADNAVRAIRIDAAGGGASWRKELTVEFSALVSPRRPALLDVLDFSRPAPVQHARVVEADRCDGSIDVLDGASPMPASVATTHFLHVRGWLARSAAAGELPETTYVTLTDAAGSRWLIAARGTPRPDVAAYFRQPRLVDAGYAVAADVSALDGEYSLGLAYGDAGTLVLCPQFRVPARIGPEATE